MKTFLLRSAAILIVASSLVTPALAQATNLFPSTGNVGIGTTNPLNKLHVEGTSTNAVGYFRNLKSWTGVEYALQVNGYSDFNGFRINGNDGPRGLYSEKRLGFGTNNKPITFETQISVEMMRIDASGNVGIGTVNPINKLEVNGTIRAKEVIVETTGWSDYVFAPDYRLAPLSEVEAAIKASGHLPGIPSAAEVAAKGVSVGEMQAKLLAKMEEMTLHQIAQEKRLDAQAARIAQLEAENAALRNP